MRSSAGTQLRVLLCVLVTCTTPHLTLADDGQARLVKDIFPGGVGSTPGRTQFADRVGVVSVGVLFFPAWDGEHGVELWKSDGTAAGTSLVKVQWGVLAENDQPMPADFDGDGKSDPTIYRPGSGLWFIARSRANYGSALAVQWGNNAHGDVPIVER